jgi:hypothetical protein
MEKLNLDMDEMKIQRAKDRFISICEVSYREAATKWRDDFVDAVETALPEILRSPPRQHPERKMRPSILMNYLLDKKEKEYFLSLELKMVNMTRRKSRKR